MADLSDTPIESWTTVSSKKNPSKSKEPYKLPGLRPIWSTPSQKKKPSKSTESHLLPGLQRYNADTQQINTSNGNITQDWNDVVLKKKQDHNTKNNKQRALRQGNFTTISTGNTGQKHNYDSRRMAKVDKETEHFAIKTVDKKLSKKIQEARLSKGLNQKELALKMNVNVDVVSKYENGTAIIDSKTIQKFQKVLGI